jgi:Holliday junction DNA helicase RuvA
MAVIMSDVNKIKSLPGIGPKTAQRIILELKDKIKNDQAIDNGKGIAEKIELTQVAEDAIDALQVLGYNRRDVEQVMSKIDTTSLTLEDAIKEGLKNLSK